MSDEGARRAKAIRALAYRDHARPAAQLKIPLPFVPPIPATVVARPMHYSS